MAVDKLAFTYFLFFCLLVFCKLLFPELLLIFICTFASLSALVLKFEERKSVTEYCKSLLHLKIQLAEKADFCILYCSLYPQDTTHKAAWVSFTKSVCNMILQNIFLHFQSIWTHCLGMILVKSDGVCLTSVINCKTNKNQHWVVVSDFQSRQYVCSRSDEENTERSGKCDCVVSVRKKSYEGCTFYDIYTIKHKTTLQSQGSILQRKQSAWSTVQKCKSTHWTRAFQLEAFLQNLTLEHICTGIFFS